MYLIHSTLHSTNGRRDAFTAGDTTDMIITAKSSESIICRLSNYVSIETRRSDEESMIAGLALLESRAFSGIAFFLWLTGNLSEIYD